MNKTLFLICCAIIPSLHAFAQLSVLKMMGRESERSKIGFGLIADIGIPVNEVGNQFINIELIDAAYFPAKDASDNHNFIGYISIKAGFRNIFNSEGRTGFFVEPQVGWCRVIRDGETKATYGDGIAAAMVAGYNLEIGERGHSINLGLKYEADIAGKNYTIQVLGLRVLYSFNLVNRRE